MFRTFSLRRIALNFDHIFSIGLYQDCTEASITILFFLSAIPLRLSLCDVTSDCPLSQFHFRAKSVSVFFRGNRLISETHLHNTPSDNFVTYAKIRCFIDLMYGNIIILFDQFLDMLLILGSQLAFPAAQIHAQLGSTTRLAITDYGINSAFIHSEYFSCCCGTMDCFLSFDQ